MSKDGHNTRSSVSQSPVHDDVAFDPRDVKTGSVLRFMAYLAIVIVASLGLCYCVLRFTDSRIAQSDAPPPPLRQGAPAALPPEPRLQGVPGHGADPQQDFRDKLAADERALEETRWVDEKAGVAEIPVEDAMRILAEKGLPAAAPKAAPVKR